MALRNVVTKLWLFIFKEFEANQCVKNDLDDPSFFEFFEDEYPEFGLKEGKSYRIFKDKMEGHLHRASLQCSEMMLLYKRTGYPISEDTKLMLERRFNIVMNLTDSHTLRSYSIREVPMEESPIVTEEPNSSETRKSPQLENQPSTSYDHHEEMVQVKQEVQSPSPKKRTRPTPSNWSRPTPSNWSRPQRQSEQSTRRVNKLPDKQEIRSEPNSPEKKTRRVYTEEEDSMIWSFVISELKLEPATQPLGMVLWRKCQEQVLPHRTAVSLASHFRKSMLPDYLTSSITSAEKLFIAEQMNFQLTEVDKEMLEADLQSPRENEFQGVNEVINIHEEEEKSTEAGERPEDDSSGDDLMKGMEHEEVINVQEVQEKSTEAGERPENNSSGDDLMKGIEHEEVIDVQEVQEKSIEAGERPEDDSNGEDMMKGIEQKVTDQKDEQAENTNVHDESGIDDCNTTADLFKFVSRIKHEADHSTNGQDVVEVRSEPIDRPENESCEKRLETVTGNYPIGDREDTNESTSLTNTTIEMDVDIDPAENIENSPLSLQPSSEPVSSRTRAKRSFVFCEDRQGEVHGNRDEKEINVSTTTKSPVIDSQPSPKIAKRMTRSSRGSVEDVAVVTRDTVPSDSAEPNVLVKKSCNPQSPLIRSASCEDRQEEVHGNHDELEVNVSTATKSPKVNNEPSQMVPKKMKRSSRGAVEDSAVVTQGTVAVSSESADSDFLFKKPRNPRSPLIRSVFGEDRQRVHGNHNENQVNVSTTTKSPKINHQPLVAKRMTRSSRGVVEDYAVFSQDTVVISSDSVDPNVHFQAHNARQRPLIRQFNSGELDDSLFYSINTVSADPKTDN